MEELTSSAQSKLSISETSSNVPRPPLRTTTTATATLGPSPPPVSNKTTAEILAELNKSPLFMTELEDNDQVAALQALAYEGTPRENAADFKERGNECFRARRWADAREFYGKGVLVLAAEERRRGRGEAPAKEGEPDNPGEVAAQRGLLELLYANRAACQLHLQNYRACTLDCAAALRLNPGCVKALYRSAAALLALGRVGEADDACARGLALEGENEGLRALARRVIAASEEMGARERKEEERLARERRRGMVLRAALRARGIRMRKTAQPPEMEDAGVALVPDPERADSGLVFPTVLLYPAHLQSDFIKAFGEEGTLAEHLAYMFPLPWDAAGEYSAAGVECYMETVAGGLIKVGKKVPLLQILGSGSVEVVDEVVRFFVLPKARADAWVKEFKMKKAAEGKAK